MAKLVVTHMNPDLDAVTAVWLVRKYFPGFSDSQIKFMPAGEALKEEAVDSNLNTVHVDTGGGIFDHHQTNEMTCAAKLVWEEVKHRYPERIKEVEEEAVDRLVAIVTEVDHARELVWCEAKSDRYELCLHQLVGGMNLLYQDDEVVVQSAKVLDAGLVIMKTKIMAERLLETGERFETSKGPGIAVEADNSELKFTAMREGYSLVVRKRTKTGHVGVYARWDREIDLTRVFEELRRLDSQATWFLHSSKCLVLNGSTKNPQMKPTKLSLAEVVAVVKQKV